MEASESENSKRRRDVDVFGLTDTGKKRSVNEDQFLVASLSKEGMLIHETSMPRDDHGQHSGEPLGSLLVVADGMGGHGGGDVASEVAVDVVTKYLDNITPWFSKLDANHEDDLVDELRGALERCHKAVRDVAETDDAADARMGTTLTMAYVAWPRLYVVHVGDSRCYLHRGSELQQITTDHTLAQQMVDQDVLEEEQVDDSKWSNILWNSVGGGTDDMDPDVYKAKLQPGDTLVLCSDGLTKHVDDDAIRKTLENENESAEKATRSLVGAANDGGGSDNITAIVARFP